MAYLKINDNDYSMYVNALKVNKSVNYNAQTNAAGNTVVDYINAKRTIEVGIIPLDNAAMTNLLAEIDNFSVSLTFLDPKTGELAENINCIVPENEAEYYAINTEGTSFNPFTIEFIEL